MSTAHLKNNISVKVALTAIGMFLAPAALFAAQSGGGYIINSQFVPISSGTTGSGYNIKAGGSPLSSGNQVTSGGYTVVPGTVITPAPVTTTPVTPTTPSGHGGGGGGPAGGGTGGNGSASSTTTVVPIPATTPAQTQETAGVANSVPSESGTSNNINNSLQENANTPGSGGGSATGTLPVGGTTDNGLTPDQGQSGTSPFGEVTPVSENGFGLTRNEAAARNILLFILPLILLYIFLRYVRESAEVEAVAVEGVKVAVASGGDKIPFLPLPGDKLKTVRVIKNAERFKAKYPQFKNAQNGDVAYFYTLETVVYRPSEKKTLYRMVI